MAALTDWSEALKDRRFWATYYGIVENTRLRRLLDVSYEDLETYFNELVGVADQPEVLADEELSDMEEGSKLSIPCPDGFTFVIAFAPGGTYYTLHHSDRQAGLLIGSEEGHFMLPTFRWTELKPIVGWIEDDWQGDFDPAALLLLLYPLAWLTRDNDLDATRHTLQAAWRRLGALPEVAVHAFVEESLHVKDIHWWYHPNRGWMTDARHAFRREDSMLFERFLALAEQHARQP